MVIVGLFLLVHLLEVLDLGVMDKLIFIVSFFIFMNWGTRLTFEILQNLL